MAALWCCDQRRGQGQVDHNQYNCCFFENVWPWRLVYIGSSAVRISVWRKSIDATLLSGYIEK